LFEPFRKGTTTFAYGFTFRGHRCRRRSMANLDIFERENLVDHFKATAPAFRTTLEKLLDLPIVGDVRGVARLTTGASYRRLSAHYERPDLPMTGKSAAQPSDSCAGSGVARVLAVVRTATSSP
jgi:adenosylmethionine-8-amino-7-oxononanoate aminotransferase